MSESPPRRLVNIEWEPDDNFRFPLSNNFVINFDDINFYVRFYQVTPPMIFGDEAPNAVKAKIVSGAAIPASRMPGIIKALQDNYQRYLERDKEEADFDFDDLDALEEEDNDDE